MNILRQISHSIYVKSKVVDNKKSSIKSDIIMTINKYKSGYNLLSNYFEKIITHSAIHVKLSPTRLNQYLVLITITGNAFTSNKSQINAH